ncbi:hypothetical protein MBLNU230_g4957t2 [Neophaeotheca triangularis]
MSDNASKPAADNAAGAGSAKSNPDVASTGAAQAAKDAAKQGARSEGNPALRMMFFGLPRPRLPSRNWTIFLSITGSFLGAVAYDRYQTRRVKQKWCDVVSHLADEPLSTKEMQRRLTIYLAAPPGDGLRSAREHFHAYVKPVLVASAMDWDVVEGRKEGDVRWKTAERIRRKRRRAGEGSGAGGEDEEEPDTVAVVEEVRRRAGTEEHVGVAGDLVIGRHTWKEYLRGMHEGWLGPVHAPKASEQDLGQEPLSGSHRPGEHSLGDAAVTASAKLAAPDQTEGASKQESFTNDEASPQSSEADQPEAQEEEAPKEEKPKPRNPPPYLTPSEYSSASLSPNAPEILGPSIGIRFPHILGFRNTPIRTYRFLTRRHLADDIGRQVASAVLAAHEPYGTVTATASEDSARSSKSGQEVPEQKNVLAFEERSWWKTVYEPRKDHEESLLLEEVALDERLANRMRKFKVTAEGEERARRIAEGKEVVEKRLGPGEEPKNDD